MPLPDDKFSIISLKRCAHFALFAVFAIGIHAVESLVTLPIPWIRPGLTHIVTLVMLPFYGTKFILGVFLVRVFVGSALVGKLFSPGFLLALGGGTAATISMIVAWRFGKTHLSFLGISLIGAWVHNLVQVVFATFIIQHLSVLALLPFFLFLSLLTGTINGLLANKISPERT